MDCPFCAECIAEGLELVLENEHCLFLQEPQRVLQGSGIIVPRAHRETVFDLTPLEWASTQALLYPVKERLDALWCPDGYNVGWNNGAAAGQSLSHVHLHVIPRFADEPYSGRGIRWWLKSDANRRPGPPED